MWRLMGIGDHASKNDSKIFMFVLINRRAFSVCSGSSGSLHIRPFGRLVEWREKWRVL